MPTEYASPTWLTIFLDLPVDDHRRGARFWRAATGAELSEARGETGEFSTLLPVGGDAHLKLQRTSDSTPKVHLDLHVSDLDAAVGAVVARGGVLLTRPGHAVLRSPAGFVFCVVTEVATAATPPSDWGTHRSRVDQLTIDVAHDAWEAETAFWSGLTGWPVLRGSRPEFARLVTPVRLPVRILLQRLGEGPTRGHVDIAADDRAQEVERLAGLGARVVRSEGGWTVMVGPDGSTFCVTDRRPDTGLLGSWPPELVLGEHDVPRAPAQRVTCPLPDDGAVRAAEQQ